MPSATNRVIVWIDPESAVIARDDGPVNAVIRRVDVEVGNTILGIGRMGTASDGEIIGVSDRLIVAFTELRAAAASRLSEREGPSRTPDGGTVCESPVCPRQAITHFAGTQGCSVSVARPPTVLRAASADRPRADEAAGVLSAVAPPSGGQNFPQPPRVLEHDEELHSGHDNPEALFAGCPACDQAFRAGLNAAARPTIIRVAPPTTATAEQMPPMTFRIPGGGVVG